MSQVQLTGQFFLPSTTTPISLGSVKFVLSVASATILPPPGGTLTNTPIVFNLDSNGFVTGVYLWGNADLSPLGTTYSMTVYNAPNATGTIEYGPQTVVVGPYSPYSGQLYPSITVLPPYISIGSGTVTAVGVAFGASATSILSVSGSPINGAGTLTFGFQTQNANLIFAGPASGGAAAPTFRGLVAADIAGLISIDGSASEGVESVVSGSVAAITSTGTLRASEVWVTKTATYTFTDADRGHIFLFSSASNIVLNCPTPSGSNFQNGWFAVAKNGNSGGNLTITPASGTIDGQATLVMPPQTVAKIECDGTNYHTGLISVAGFIAQNLVYASPTSGSGLPRMRQLVDADIKRTAALLYVIDGGGGVPLTGAQGQVSIPIGCTLTGWVITADQSGSAVVDVLRSTYAGFPSTSSIAGTDKPTLSSAQKNEDLALSGWGSTALNTGDIIQFNLNSVATINRLNISLNITIP